LILSLLLIVGARFILSYAIVLRIFSGELEIIEVLFGGKVFLFEIPLCIETVSAKNWFLPPVGEPAFPRVLS